MKFEYIIHYPAAEVIGHFVVLLVGSLLKRIDVIVVKLFKNLFEKKIGSFHKINYRQLDYRKEFLRGKNVVRI